MVRGIWKCYPEMCFVPWWGLLYSGLISEGADFWKRSFLQKLFCSFSCNEVLEVMPLKPHSPWGITVNGTETKFFPHVLSQVEIVSFWLLYQTLACKFVHKQERQMEGSLPQAESAFARHEICSCNVANKKDGEEIRIPEYGWAQTGSQTKVCH